jgi:hypothetical protein
MKLKIHINQTKKMKIMSKNMFLIIVGILLTASVFAQAPQKMSYQAIVRNSSNALIVSTPIGIKISVIQGSVNGTVTYSETQLQNTNMNGLVSLEIGTGTPVLGTFSNINWSNGPYFIKSEIDPNGSTNYSVQGITELISVPYALYSGNTQVSGFSHYIGEAFNGGIIYYLYKGSDGLEHGLIVSTTETLAQWQSTSSLVNANRSWDGAYNTSLMTLSPAANYIANLGPNWYLPSLDELILLHHSRFQVNKALFTNSQTLLSLSLYYYSSTEYSNTEALGFDFMTGYSTNIPKSSQSYGVRGVKSF